MSVRASRRDQYGGEHDAGGQHAVAGEAGRVGLSHGVAGVGNQQEGEGDQIEGQAADPGEEIPIAQQGGPLVVTLAQLGGQGGTGHLIEGDEGADDDGHPGQVEKQMALGPVWRVPQQQVGNRHRRGRGVHERVAPAPARTPIVRHLADDGVEEGVEDHGDHDRQSDQRRAQAHHLIVEQQQQIAEAVVLHPEGHRAEAVEEFGGDREGRF